jgi:hypothetical protein
MEKKPELPGSSHDEMPQATASAKQLPSGDEEHKGGDKVEHFQDRVTNILRKTKRTYTSSQFKGHGACHPDSPRSKEEGDQTGSKPIEKPAPLAPITEKEGPTEKPAP